MAKWIMKCIEFKRIREIINDENPDLKEIVKGFINICSKYEKRKWDFADDFADMKEELEALNNDNLDDEEVDYYLGKFYDLCDVARIFLDL